MKAKSSTPLGLPFLKKSSAWLGLPKSRLRLNTRLNAKKTKESNKQKKSQKEVRRKPWRDGRKVGQTDFSQEILV